MDNEDFRQLLRRPPAEPPDQQPEPEPDPAALAVSARLKLSWPELVGYDGRLVRLAVQHDRPDVRVVTALDGDLSSLEGELGLQLEQDCWEARAVPLNESEEGGEAMELLVLLVVQRCRLGRENDTTVSRVPWVARRVVCAGASKLPQLELEPALEPELEPEPPANEMMGGASAEPSDAGTGSEDDDLDDAEEACQQQRYSRIRGARAALVDLPQPEPEPAASQVKLMSADERAAVRGGDSGGDHSGDDCGDIGKDMWSARDAARQRYAASCARGVPLAAERCAALVIPACLSHAEVEQVHAAASAAAGESSGIVAKGKLGWDPVGKHIKTYLHRRPDPEIDSDSRSNESTAAELDLTSWTKLCERIVREMQQLPCKLNTNPAQSAEATSASGDECDWGPEVGSHQELHVQELHVRCIEYHTYNIGGGLVSAGHCDAGSALTLSVLLSDPDSMDGGDFITYTDGEVVQHKLNRGDGILFRSEKHHNVQTVRSGQRQSLVIVSICSLHTLFWCLRADCVASHSHCESHCDCQELWAHPPNCNDRFS